MNRTLLSTMVLGLLLTSCGATGPLPTFGKTITPEWISTDFNGQKSYIATSNLQDIIFNDRGEITGWYIKNNAGTPYIRQRADGTYDFSALNAQRGAINIVAGHTALTISADSLKPDQPVKVTAPQLTQDLAQNRQDAVFRYTQQGITVTKTFTLHPRNFTIEVHTQVDGVPAYDMNFFGLGKDDAPRVQAVAVGGQPTALQGSGTLRVDDIQYAALQEKPSQVTHALIVRPQTGTTADASLTGGPQGLLQLHLRGSSALEVYGGKNELIHLYQSGYMNLPGLFQPNLFGNISLLIVKLMETLYKSVSNWGIVIILLTILLRLVMWPLMQAQGRTTARMQIMQPKIKEIQEKYKTRKDLESQRAMQLEMQQLYRDYNFNPAGCFSTFLPFPVLIALWSTIRNFEFDSGFLWLPDLAVPDPFYILALIYLVVNIGQLYVMTRKTPDMFRQQAMIYLVFLYFALTFPSGVTIYIILSTLIGIGQQIIINQQVERETTTLGQSVEKVSRKKVKTLDS